MKTPLHLVEERRAKLSALLSSHRYLPVRDICRRLGVSEATARRDLAHLEKHRHIRRTFGGALTDYDSRFPPFRERLRHAAAAKREIARTSLALVPDGSICYFDSGTTVHALAEAVRDSLFQSLTVVTNNLPVAETLSGLDGIRICLIGGELLPSQSLLLGESACRAAKLWSFTRAFLSAEGATRKGLWNTRPEVVSFQRAVMSRAEESIFLIDATKIGTTTAHHLCAWNKVGSVITDSPLESAQKCGVPANKILYPREK